MTAARFSHLWQRNISDGQAWKAERVYAQLSALYAEDFRSYHNHNHIDCCLTLLDQHRNAAADPDAIELAIWFHDACYGPDPVGHENRSAMFFREVSADGITLERQNRICQLIMATTHQSPPKDKDSALLVDIDLGSFGLPWHDYLKDTARCRAERLEMDDITFCYKQISFLKSLLARPSIYFTPVFASSYEQQALSNIAKLLTLLNKRVDNNAPNQIEKTSIQHQQRRAR